MPRPVECDMPECVRDSTWRVGGYAQAVLTCSDHLVYMLDMLVEDHKSVNVSRGL